ncbi:MAG: hypothetical protein DHS80DRAFT_29927 [Piptocephalis tieghemiana]|nr:MAG: hypothetical protein DHS80DRAFT_29927 [Piptocephalis tieghemiana]
MSSDESQVRPSRLSTEWLRLALLAWTCVSWSRASTPLPPPPPRSRRTVDPEGLGRRARRWRNYLHLTWVYLLLRRLGPRMGRGSRGLTVKETMRYVLALTALLLLDEACALFPLRLLSLWDRPLPRSLDRPLNDEDGEDAPGGMNEDCAICFGTGSRVTQAHQVEAYCTKSERHMAHPRCFLSWMESQGIESAGERRWERGREAQGPPCPVCRSPTEYVLEQGWTSSWGGIRSWALQGLQDLEGYSIGNRFVEVMAWGAGVWLSGWIGQYRHRSLPHPHYPLGNQGR